MPTTYAHYRLGRGVRKLLDGDERRIIEANIELFNIGLHGPDLLFYYKPLKSNAVNRLGHELHNRTGMEFFGPVINKLHEVNNKAPYLAYMYGVICHFVLDVYCHGYIADKIAQSGISHAEIEAEFDRYLMVKDGLNPISFKPANHIVPSRYNAVIIAGVYSGIYPDEALAAIKGLKLYSNFLVSPSKLKRKAVLAGLKMSGNYGGMHGMIINYKPNPDCFDSTRILMIQYKKAGRLAVRLIEEFKHNIDGSKSLDSIYRYTFDPRTEIEDIVI